GAGGALERVLDGQRGGQDLPLVVCVRHGPHNRTRFSFRKPTVPPAGPVRPLSERPRSESKRGPIPATARPPESEQFLPFDVTLDAPRKSEDSLTFMSPSPHRRRRFGVLVLPAALIGTVLT